MANTSVNFKIGLNTTADLQGVRQVQSALNSLSSQIETLKKNERWMALNDTDAELLSEYQRQVENLGKAMTSAFNPTLNMTDLKAFKSYLDKTEGGIGNVKKGLTEFGTEGTKAFNQVITQITKMGSQVTQTNSLLDKFTTSFFNIVKYQLITRAFTTVTKTISDSFRYVKELDKSLNSIRIVTNKSAEDMANFAKYANEAAKSLGTTTTSYTDASLIYFQQGLDEETVKKRTDVTTKMMNVTGESAETVSSYMTAIWNNFDNGSESVEHYADVIAALGASTAASSEEIAEGLEKFSAVAETTGLSYEYATSALATVVAVTRQSAYTVGTAFKTLFARIQDLELGKTLDDGTTLGKYSLALQAVGINIKDTSGGLKDMNTILDELGAKWSTLDEDTQVALAQNVAGTRQYTQLVALMDSWSQFQKNVKTAESSTGTLQSQQNIYMEGIATKEKELKAASEELASSLFDEESIKGLIDFGKKFIEIINAIVKSMGGLKAILPLVIGSLTKLSSGKIGQFFAQQSYNSGIKKWADQISKDNTFILDTLKKNNVNTNGMSNNGNGVLSFSSNVNTQVANEAAQNANAAVDELIDKTLYLIKNNKNLDESQKQTYANYQEYLTEAINKNYKLLVLEEKRAKLGRVKVNKNGSGINYNGNELTPKKIQNNLDFGAQDSVGQYQIQNVISGLENGAANIFLEKNFIGDAQLAEKIIESLIRRLQNCSESSIGLSAIWKEFKEVIKSVVSNELEEVNNKFEQEQAEVDNINESLKKQGKIIKNGENAAKTAETVTTAASSFMSLASALNMAKTAGKMFTEEDVDITTVLTNLSSTVLTVIMTINSLQKVISNLASTTSTAIGGIKTGLSSGNWIIAAAVILITIITTVTEAIITEQEKIKKTKIETIKTLITKDKELVSQYEEEYKSVLELRDAYDDLKDTYLKQGESIDSLKNKALELSAAYGTATDQLKILSAQSEEDITNTVNNIENKYRKKLTAQYLSSGENIITDNGLSSALQENELDINTKGAGNNWAAFFGAFNLGPHVPLDRFGTVGGYLEQAQKIQNTVLSLESAPGTTVGSAVNEDRYDKTVSFYGELAKEDKLNLDSANFQDYQAFTEAGELVLNKKTLKNIALNYDNIISFINENSSTQDFAVIKRLKEVFESDTVKTAITNYLEAREGYLDSFSENFAENNKTVENFVDYKTEFISYQKELKKASDEIFGYTSEEIEEQFDKKFLEKGGNANLVRIKDLLEKIEGKKLIEIDFDDKGIKEEINFLNSLDTELTKFLIINIDAISTKNDIDNIKKDFSSFIDWANKKDIVVKVKTILENQDEKATSFEEKDIDALYNEDIFNSTFKIDRSDFNRMTYDEQNLKLQQYQFGLSSGNLLSAEEKDGLKRQIESKKDQYINKVNIGEYESFFYDGENSNSIVSQYPKWFEENESILSETEKATWANEETLNTLINQLINGEELTDDTSKLYNRFINNSEYFNKDSLEENITNYKQILDNIKTYDSALNSLNDTTFSTKERINACNEMLVTYNKRLDNTQSAYTILKKATEEYNNNGALTLDTLQSLITLNPEYINALEETEKGYQVNKDKIVELLKAELMQQELELSKTALDSTQILLSKEKEAREAALADMIIKTTSAVEEDTLTKFENAKSNIETAYSLDYLTEAERDESLAFVNSLETKAKNIRKFANDLTADSLDFATGNSSGTSTKDFKQFDEEFDRYKELNDYLEQIADALKELDDLQKDLHGVELIKSLENENRLLEQQAEAMADLSAAYDQEISQRQKDAAGLGYNIDIDDNGYITNYSKVSQQALNDYNAAVSAFNAGTITEEEFEAAEKKYEKFKNNIEGIDDAADKKRNNEDDLKENLQKRLDNEFKIKTEELQIDLDFNKAERSMNTFLAKMKKGFNKVTSMDSLMGDFDVATKNLDTYFSGKGGTGKGDIALYEGQMTLIEDEIDKLERGETSKFKSISEAQAALKEAQENYTKSAEEAYDQLESMYELFNKAMDEYLEGFDELQKKFDKVSKTLTYWSELTELIYGDTETGLKLRGENYSAQYNSTMSQLQSLNVEKASLEEQLAKTSEDDENYDKIKKRLDETEASIRDTAIKVAKAAQQVWFNTVDQITTKWNNELTKAQEKWANVKWYDEKFFDGVEKVYNLSSLQNKFDKTLNNSSNLSLGAQQKIKNLQNEIITSLKEKNKLTEYDVQLAEKKLSLAEAEMTLEEAKNNKNSMTMVRGADGNWSYQYVANIQEVEDAQQKVLDASNDIYTYTKESAAATKEEIYSLYQDYYTKFEEISKKTYASEEERQAALDELYQNYFGEGGKITLTYDSYNSQVQDWNEATFTALLGYENADVENVRFMTETEKGLLEDFKINGIQSMTDFYSQTEADRANWVANFETDFDTIKNYFGGENGIISDMVAKNREGADSIINAWNADEGESVRNQIKGAIDAVIEAVGDFKTKCNEVAEEVGEDWGENGISGAISEAEQAAKDAKKATEDYATENNEKLDIFRKKLDEQKKAWEAIVWQVESAVTKVEDYLRKLGELDDITIEDKSYEVTEYRAVVDEDGNRTGGLDQYRTTKPVYEIKTDPYGVSGTFGVYNTKKGTYEKIFNSKEEAQKWIDDNADTHVHHDTRVTGEKTTDDQTIDKEEKYKNNFSSYDIYKFTIYGADRQPKKTETLVYPTQEQYMNKVDELWSQVVDYGGLYAQSSITGNDRIKWKSPLIPTDLYFDGNKDGISDDDLYSLFKLGSSGGKFDTGGYTGDWAGSEGKLAILHSKELVLNKDDTENMLKTVQIMNDMNSKDLSTLLKEKTLDLLRASLEATGNEISKITEITKKDTAAEQTFNISAEFPNANNVDEIREAILSLPNLAAQKAGVRVY